MDMGVGSGCSGDEQQDSPSSSSDVHNNKDKKSRHTSNQIQLLEAFFKECPHPNDDQKRQLSRDLGLDLKQIKFWFQNKRTQTKAQVDRADNGVLRAENERISCENLAFKEALNKFICPACGGSPFGEDNSLDSLRLQNAQLRLERDKLSKLVERYTGKTPRYMDSLMEGRTSTSRLGITGGASSSMMNNTNITHNQQNEILGSSSSVAARGGNNKLQLTSSSTSSLTGLEIVESSNDKGFMMKMAARGLEEVYKLLRINEPLWMKPNCDDIDHDGGTYTLDRSSYQKLFQLPTAQSSTHHFESSKHTALVPINSLHLVDAFLDSAKWSDLFSTIVTQAKTIQVLETGTPNNRSGSVQLMYEEIHVLSPLVPSRQYYFLRSCQQIADAGLWVIADVSCSRRNDNTTSNCSWRLPSGCMIQDLSNGYSKVTWVEHIAEDKRQYGGLYRGILSSGLAYGAQRWVSSLERQTQRLITMNYLSSKHGGQVPPHDESLAAARNSSLIMKVAGRMVKGFCAALQNMSMTSTTEASNMKVSVRQGEKGLPGDPIGTIIGASTSLWLPIPHQQLINFLRQVKTRMLWDVLANGNPMYEVASISSADGLLHPGNSISIMQPITPVDNSMLLQEICTDKNTGSSLLVYAPIDIAAFTTLLTSSNLEDDSDCNTNLERLSLLPLGFTICASDPPSPPPSSSHENEVENGYTGNDTKISGSLLTAAFQMLVSGPSTSSSSPDGLQLQTTMDCIATINVLLNSTVHKIKDGFNCSASS